ncbi:hypothetical protein BWQ96_10438 [Gracilariopsis chorda]|uniref:Uncharacterized protein n=1 Tax=Gracilariopsis chorda TaxID=448386 RepID=A0A2V3ICP1_9FLOR|nr:hypothetical protein BWQ96_10438 [Gracilariopsis chorda]|eukprot:PXF39859.1 hypothetical protein BWQ96_10438 [Gracilariopsis chorda]
MWYRMEWVRTVLGRWVESFHARSGNELCQDITTDIMKDVRVDVELSKIMGGVSKERKWKEMLGRRGILCRLMWELQNELENKVMSKNNWETRNEEDKETRNGEKAVKSGRTEMGATTMMLMLLAFPGLKAEVV